MHVTHLRHCAIKGTRHRDHASVEVGASGVVGDRQFALVDPDSLAALKTVRHPTLTLVASEVAGDEVVVTLPGGATVRQRLAEGGASVRVGYWGRSIAATAEPGPVSDALADVVGRPALLVRAAGEDRFIYGPPVAVWFTHELAALGGRVGAELDPRRFRLAIGLSGDAPALGSTLVMGDAELRMVEPIVRCPIVDWDVESAAADLDVLARLREGGRRPVFGYGCTVVRSGRVRVGDAASVGFLP